MGVCVCCGKWRPGSELAGAWVCCECQKDIENYSEEMEIKEGISRRGLYPPTI